MLKNEKQFIVFLHNFLQLYYIGMIQFMEGLQKDLNSISQIDIGNSMQNECIPQKGR